jgi:1-acyl-sn-glycerol-3-phosphate acyltransferase
MEPWSYHPAADLDQQLLARLRRFPREPDMLAYGIRSIAAVLTRSWLRRFHRFTVTGRENIPASGSFVLVSNHCSHLDALCLLSAVPLHKLHRTFSAAAADYFFVSPRRAVMAVLLVNALPFDREVRVRQSLRLCQELLANPGNVLVLFPEGSRSTGGQIRPFRHGIGLLVAGSSIPVIPCHLDGTHRALPKRAAIPRPYAVKLTIGEPRSYANLAPGKTAAAEVARDLESAVRLLAQQSSAAFVGSPKG